MATASRRETGTLTELVLKQHDSVNVFQLMRLLLAKQSPSWPIEKRLRFRADLSAGFPGREFSSVLLRKNVAANERSEKNSTHISASKNAEPQGQVIDIRTANYCIASILGPLPEPFTEWVRDLERARDPAMADFLNMFNQRLNILRYELKSALTIGLNNLPPAQTPQAHALAALMGLGLPKLAAQVPLHPRAWLGLAGLLSNSRKSASTVKHVLSLYLHADVTLVPLIGAWQNIEAEDRMVLGRQNRQLGQNTVVGRRVWDQQARVRLIIGPLDYQRMCHLLPPNRADRRARLHAAPQAQSNPASTSTFQSFLGLLHLLLDRLVDCEIELHVDRNTIPDAFLASRALPHSPNGSNVGLRLGQTAWLHKNKASERDQSAKSSVPSDQRCVSYLVRAYDDESSRVEAS